MKRLLVPASLALAATLLALLLRSPLSTLEHGVIALQYTLRGDQRADTNIVLVYIDNDAIRELGWPLRRNFHALMVKALTDVQAGVIGIDLLFENPSAEYPEYDQLLRHVVAVASNVVLGGTFGRIGAAEAAPAADARAPFRYPQVTDVETKGAEFHAPMQSLLEAAAGVGHVNVLDDLRLPLFIAHGEEIVPSLGMEVLRVYAHLERAAVRYEDGTLSYKRDGKLVRIATDGGAVSLNYPGRLTSFNAYPFLEVLRAYDALRAGRTPAIPLQSFKNKIILVGVVSEERTFATPIDPRYPAIGLHAVFLDNALHSGFLVSVPSWFVYVLCLVVGFGCAAPLLLMTSRLRLLIPAVLLVAGVVCSHILFAAFAVVLPIMSFVVVGLITIGGALVYRHRVVARQLEKVQSEKERITAELRDREAKVAALERELVSLEARKQTDRTQELLDEIRRYKAEIHALSSKRDDLEEANVADTEATDGAQEFEGMVYDGGGVMRRVVDFVAKIADSDATVLILGESGTGKEMVARAIHRRSRRNEHPFVAVNCGALAETLLESELFGHEKGAFTGAVKEKQGRFELADRGTIFLDEIGEVSEAFQLKLLRVLQEGEFERVGGMKTLKVNVRVIAATNKDLKQMVKERRFREDLYYRLNVLTIEIPPLRERPGDIPLLIHHFLKRQGEEFRVSRNVLDILQNHVWRGNIRELESVITRAALLAKAENRTMITTKDLPDEITSTVKGTIAIEDQILELLREKKFSRSAISETAEELGGLNRGTVAEYFRGQCLKAFVDHTYDLETTARFISLAADDSINERVRKKLLEYLANIAEAVDRSQPWDNVKPALKPKMKNLPQKYHRFLEQVAEGYYRSVWSLEEKVR